MKNKDNDLFDDDYDEEDSALILLFHWFKDFNLKKFCIIMLSITLCIGVVGFAYTKIRDYKASWDLNHQMKELNKIISDAKKEDSTNDNEEDVDGIKRAANGMLAEYEALYKVNKDIVGWLAIDDTNIDYPVMQTPLNEEYYLYKDFYKKYNKNGCLILDTDSTVGVPSVEAYDVKEQLPSTNLIIHGHTMHSGDMFGRLTDYKDEEYGLKHNVIKLDTLYEHREYELLCAFYSQVYAAEDNVFRYYQFFQADTQAEFDNWYNGISKLSLYDTGVKASFGDEFITLSCCAYHTKDGRFVVVGKRIK